MSDPPQSPTPSKFEYENRLLGKILGNYRVERVIGRGGMATVFFGQDTKLNRPVAIKVLDPRFQDNEGYAERFIRESQIVASWRHPNILQIYYADDFEGNYFFAMEYIDGLDLGQLVGMYGQDDQLMPTEDILRIGFAVAEALDYAHAQGVVHRDIKPSNVMVAYSGRVLLTDFGLAMQLTDRSAGEVFGTPHYMAPEQAKRSANAVPESDIYSLSVMLFEMLTGQVPFDDESPTSVALMHLTETPPMPSAINPNLSKKIDNIILSGLAKEPKHRFHTARELMDALYEAIQGKPSAPKPLAELHSLIEHWEEEERDLTGIESEGEMTVADRLVLEKKNSSMLESLSLATADTVTPQPGDLAAQITADLLPSSSAPEEQEAESEPPSRNLSWLSGLLLISGIVLVGLAYFFSPLAQNRLNPPAAAPPVPSEPAESAIVVVTPTSPPTETATLSAVIVGSLPTAISTAAPTESSADDLASEDVPSPVPSETPIPTATATPIANPDLILLFSNPLAFYIYNPTAEKVEIEQLTFIAVREDGRLTSFAYTGSAFGNTLIEPGRCNGLELIEERPELRPERCDGFNWLNFPGSETTARFWQSQPELDILRFQVFSDGQLIQTCPILAGSCAIALP